MLFCLEAKCFWCNKSLSMSEAGTYQSSEGHPTSGGNYLNCLAFNDFQLFGKITSWYQKVLFSRYQHTSTYNVFVN